MRCSFEGHCVACKPGFWNLESGRSGSFCADALIVFIRKHRKMFVLSFCVKVPCTDFNSSNVRFVEEGFLDEPQATFSLAQMEVCNVSIQTNQYKIDINSLNYNRNILQQRNAVLPRASLTEVWEQMWWEVHPPGDQAVDLQPGFLPPAGSRSSAGCVPGCTAIVRESGKTKTWYTYVQFLRRVF